MEKVYTIKDVVITEGKLTFVLEDLEIPLFHSTAGSSLNTEEILKNRKSFKGKRARVKYTELSKYKTPLYSKVIEILN